MHTQAQPRNPAAVTPDGHVQVRQAREEGALRIRTLEESLARLSLARGPGEQRVEVARLVADMEAAVRGQARAAADVDHLRRQLAQEAAAAVAAAAEIADREKQLAEMWVYTAFGPAAARYPPDNRHRRCPPRWPSAANTYKYTLNRRVRRLQCLRRIRGWWTRAWSGV